MSQQMHSDNNSVAKKLLSNKKEKIRDGHHTVVNGKKKKRKKNQKDSHHDSSGHSSHSGHSHHHHHHYDDGHNGSNYNQSNHNHSNHVRIGNGSNDHRYHNYHGGNGNAVDVDEEVPKCDWKQYLKGRFISRDSIIVAPVIAKFNNEEAISDNFKAYGRITRINMWDDESAHIMYDKQCFVCYNISPISSMSFNLFRFIKSFHRISGLNLNLLNLRFASCFVDGNVLYMFLRSAKMRALFFSMQYIWY